MCYKESSGKLTYRFNNNIDNVKLLIIFRKSVKDLRKAFNVFAGGCKG
jgi:hypothetical protein